MIAGGSVLAGEHNIAGRGWIRGEAAMREILPNEIASGEPERRTGVRSPAAASRPVCEPVAIQPGAIALTVTPCGAASSAMARVC